MTSAARSSAEERGEQTQARLLAFLRMELGGGHVVPLDGGGDAVRAVRGPRRDERWVARHRVVAVDEVDVRWIGVEDAERPGAGPRELQAVPAHVGDLYRSARRVDGPVGEAQVPTGEEAEAARPRRLVALVEQRLQAETDPEV